MAISHPIKQWKVELLVCVIFHCLFSSIRLSREEQIHHWRNWLTSFSWFVKTQQTTTSLLYNYDHIRSTPNVNITESFDYLEDPVSATTSLVRQGFYGPTVVALTGSNEISCKEDKAKFNTHAPVLSLKIIFAASLLKLYIWSKRTRQICGFCTSRTWWCRSQQLSFHLFFWKMKSNDQSV